MPKNEPLLVDNLDMKSSTPPTIGRKSSLSIRSKGAPPHEAQSECQLMRPSIMDRIISLSPVPTIVLNSSFDILEVSSSHINFSGLDRDDYIGASLYNLDPAKIPVTSIEALRNGIDKAIKLKSVCKIDSIEVVSHSYYCNLRISPIFENDSSLVYIILESCDITKIHREGDVVDPSLDAPDIYKHLIDSVKHVVIFMLTPEGNVATWNDGASALKGYAAEEIIGQHFSIFYSQEDRLKDKPRKELDKCLQDGKLEDEGWRVRKDGTKFFANVVISPVYRFRVLVGFSKVTRDITDRKETEDRLVAAYEESAKLKSQFLANMSHEIRTPMHGMLAALTLLKDTGLNDKQDEYARIIENSGSILLRVINDILDYSKLSSGTFTLNSDLLSVQQIHRNAIQHCQTLLKSGVILTSEVAEAIPEFSKGDPLRYQQILQNLLMNSAKFTESGSIHVRSKLTSDESSSHRVHTEVIDTGIGVPAEAAKRLFDPFTQVFSSTGEQYQGIGLGLAICRNLIDFMGGSIGYHPNPDGQGSVFWFSVRLGKVDVATSPGPSGALSPIEMEPIEELKSIAPGKQLLLVEDNKISQAVMLKLLKNLGFGRVDAAYDGAQALKMLRGKPFSYHAVLMDINMPVMDGVEATVEIRNSLRLDIPIIAMTANALQGDAEMYLSKGMDGYVSKPVNRNHLIKILVRVLR
ncbi:two-component system protein A [Paracoccidioides lutzii Pb01]|uniref:Two-component system protein A n=1 Tax=Paracoccidioides lutzii (strain ATCC MYA-826 / Pb01) TaxID=502779 RepID=C1GNM6_PARBA|nr:two-component system protein A [Paracoccidioides lutzii Pb01]EEH35798.2 two-component system protein A [Paracoccidioides lutzii Pb01]